jgi:hypothetical protein
MTKPGRDADGIAKTDGGRSSHEMPRLRAVDMRDLGQVLEHVHDAEVEVSEGPPSGGHKPGSK